MLSINEFGIVQKEFESLIVIKNKPSEQPWSAGFLLFATKIVSFSITFFCTSCYL